jgi:hypothetical protein
MVKMQLIITPNSRVLQVTRQELKHYLDQSTESFITGKRRMIFPVKDSDIDTLVVNEDV